MTNLEAYRKLRGLTQYELAYECFTNQPTISLLESGQGRADRDLLERIATSLKFKEGADQLLEEFNDEHL